MDAFVDSSRLIPAIAVPEGAGVTVYRTIGAPALRNYDPSPMMSASGMADLCVVRGGAARRRRLGVGSMDPVQ